MDASGALQAPQSPPHPLSPQTLPSQAGVQTHCPFWQLEGASQVPQLPPQPSSPQALSPHCGGQGWDAVSSGAAVSSGLVSGAVSGTAPVSCETVG